MGYYTYYNLTTGDNNIGEHVEKLSILTGYAKGSFLGTDSIKWYDHEEDMKGYSVANPNVLFKLQGRGEEPDDVWIKYFKNGKMQECKCY